MAALSGIKNKMDASLLTGLIIGFIVSMVVFFFFAVVVFLLVLISKAKWTRIIRVTNITAGLPQVELHKARLIKHPKLGDCYEVPKLRKEGRQFIQFYGSKYEYPTTKSRVKFVPVTFYQNVYAPEKYEYTERVEMETIEKIGKKYEKVKKEVIRAIVTPLKSSMRQFNLAADKAIDEEYNIPVGWFERNKALILSLGMIMITATLCILMIIFTYQASVEGAFSVNEVPDWARTLLDAVTSGQAPPPAGDIAP